MRLIYSAVFLFISMGATFAQKSKLSIIKEKKIKIVNVDVDANPDKFPIVTIAIQNATKENIIFDKIWLNLFYVKKYPRSSSSSNELDTKELTPIVSWDMSLPIVEDKYIYTPKYPIQIAKKDAATIQIRLHCDVQGKNIVPNQYGVFKFNLAFITYDNKAILTKEIKIGN